MDSGRGGDWTDEPCKRSNFLWKRSIGGDFKNVNCASINHITNFWVSPTGEFQQLWVQLKQKNLQIPTTVIQIVFTRYSDHSRRIVYKVNLNPEIFGFEPDPEPKWGANSWYKDYSSKDPKKAEFITHLSKWVTMVQERMESAFSKEKDSFNGVPPLEAFLSKVDK